jgi:hypothetical protein
MSIMSVTLASPVVLLGDRFSTKNQAWVSSLEGALSTEHPLVNLSIGGLTTGDAMMLVDAVESKYHPKLLILVLGWSDGYHHVSLSKVTEHWDRIIQKRRGKPTLIFGVSLPKNHRWQDSYRVSFNHIVGILSSNEHEKRWVEPNLLALVPDDPRYWDSQRFYPSDAAQPLIAKHVEGVVSLALAELSK